MLPPVRSRAFSRSAFSLVEVALAIAVVSFAVIGILSLMSTGLGTYRQVMDTTICAQIAQRIINDAEQANFNTLTDNANVARSEDAQTRVGFSFRAPQMSAPALRYFDEQGHEIVPSGPSGTLSLEEKPRAIYAVNIRIIPRAQVPREDARMTDLAHLTIEIASNPTGMDLRSRIVNRDTDPRYNLFDVPPGIKVLTYSAYIGRNE